VRECGRFWVCEVRERLERFGRGRIRREARIRTCRSENFFSSSRVRLEGVSWRLSKGGGGEVPLLDFVEAGKEGDRDEDDDCFFAVADFEL